MIKYLFCHGFGFDINYWENLSPLLIAGERYSIDLGYFNTPTTNDLIKKYNDNKSIRIGIGHSLGFAKLISMNIDFDIMIGINAFCNFLGNDQLHDTRKKEHSNLVKQFHINPTLTLKKFYKRCGLSQAYNNLDIINTCALIQDLDFLLSRVILSKNIPILIINTLDDIIIPPAITLDNFANLSNVNIKLLNTGNHAIILNNPIDVANLINHYTNEHISKTNN